VHAHVGRTREPEPPIASFLKSMLIGGGPVNAVVRGMNQRLARPTGFFFRVFRSFRGYSLCCGSDVYPDELSGRIASKVA
ncbi:MAG: hypothetical protein KDB00_08775, partial [Planctomycetales bacterium]|nr:hypothetical protein [Planctomycetales bacterium]